MNFHPPHHLCASAITLVVSLQFLWSAGKLRKVMLLTPCSLFYKTSLHLWTILTAEPSHNEQEESWIQWSLKTRSARRTGQWSPGSSKETAGRRVPPGTPPSRTQDSTSRCAR